MILDYSDYVEMACEEESGTYRSYASAADVARSAYRFIDPSMRPADVNRVSQKEHDTLYKRWWEYECSRYELFGDWFYLPNCPYCAAALTHTETPGDQSNPYVRSVVLRVCDECGWWESDENDWPDETTGRSVHRRALLKEFCVAGGEAPIAALHKYIVGHPSALREISPPALEKLVSSVFRDFMNCEAIHIGGPNDDGIDIILVDGDRRYVVQVKRRQSAHATEGVSGIREFLGAMMLDGAVRGLFVSTARRFSKQAKSASQRAQSLGLIEKIQLIDATRLLEVCKLTATKLDEPWRNAQSNPDRFVEHVNPGFQKFMELAMGSPKWRVVRYGT
jgi:restriction system protein